MGIYIPVYNGDGQPQPIYTVSALPVCIIMYMYYSMEYSTFSCISPEKYII